MKTIIAGSRNITDYSIVLQAIIDANFDITAVVSGTARGVDQLGEKFANDSSLQIHKFPAQWDEYGKSAGYIRNKQMAEFSDALIAVWDGKSKGTKHMIDLAYKYNLKVYIHYIEEE